MAKSKKSKILAMALCASVMTGIYASPVMAEELYVDSSQSVTTNGVGKTKIASLEGLKEITLGDSVKITTTDGGIIRVGNAGGVNTRVHKDGFYVNTSGDDRKTSLKAGTLTLAGIDLTSEQLDIINDVITNDGAVVDVTSKAADGKTYSLNTVGKNTSGIRRAGTTDENRSTYIEETVRVNNNSGLVVYAEDGKTFAAQIDREGNVLTEGVGRFGALEGPNVRMENGVLSINSEGTNAVASLSKDGLMLSDSVNGQQTLTVAKIADIQHIKHVGNATVIEQNTAISADGIVVKDPGSGVSTKTKYNGFYVKDEYGNNVSSLKNDGLRLTDAQSGRQILNATDIADIKGIDRSEGATAPGTGTTTIEGATSFTKDGMKTSSFTAGVTEDSIYHINAKGEMLFISGGNAIGMNRDGIGFRSGTESVTINGDGTTFTSGSGDSATSTVIKGGTVTASNDFVTTNADGSTKYKLNTVGADLDALETNVGNISGNVAGIKRNAGAAYGEGRTEIEGVVGVNGKDGRFYVLGEDGITQAAVITNDGTARFGDYNNANVRMENGVLSINSEGTNAVASLSKDGLMLSDSVSGVSTKTKYNGFYVKDKYRKIVSSLKDDGLMLTDQDSGQQTLNATDIADIKGIDRDIVEETFGDVTTTTKTTTIEGALKVSDNGFISNANESFTVDANGTLTAAGGRFTVSDVTGAHFYGSDSMFSDYTNINGGRIEINGADGSQTVINGNSITTETLNVEKIVLGDKIVDKETGDVIGELEIGANGSIKIADKFEVDTDNLAAHYGKTSLNMDSDGFNLNYGTGENAPSLVLNGSGFAFAGPVNLGASDDVSYVHNGATIKLSDLTGRVEILEEKTTGISYNKDTGSTTITNTENLESSLTVGQDGTTFEGTGVGTTNINGGKVTVNGNDSTVTTIDGSEIVSDATASSTVTGGAGAGTGTVNGGYAEFDKGEGGKTIVDGGNVNVSNKITVGTGTTEITGDNVIVGVHDANKSNIGKGEATFDKGEDDKTIVNGGNVTTGNITADTGKIGNVEFTADGTTFEDGSENQTVIDKNGIVVGANDGTKIDKDDVSINDKNGGRIHLSDMGQVDNIDAELKQNDNYDDTVVGGINAEADIRRTEVARLDDRITKVEDRVDKVGAMSAAIANLRTMGYDPAAPTEIAVGIGQYRSETGVALGMFHYPNKDFMLSLSVSTSGDEVMGGIGATWKFGRKSPEKVLAAEKEKAAKAKLAKAEEMKQAAKEAKIKAQQERHAKLAAQAEAAK